MLVPARVTGSAETIGASLGIGNLPNLDDFLADARLRVVQTRNGLQVLRRDKDSSGPIAEAQLIQGRMKLQCRSEPRSRKSEETTHPVGDQGALNLQEQREAPSTQVSTVCLVQLCCVRADGQVLLQVLLAVSLPTDMTVRKVRDAEPATDPPKVAPELFLLNPRERPM